MSPIRFLHTDSLRLGSPVAGLSDSPEWLRKTAASAVRTAVTNVIEAAVAGRCQFLVIAGRLTESDQDLDLAVAWLMAHGQTFREHGIRLVILGHSEADFAVLKRLDAILVAPGHRLDVWESPSGRLDHAVTSRTVAARSGTLGIQCDTVSSGRPLADLAYVAVPSVSASAGVGLDGTATAHDRHLRLSAGSPQSLSPSERGVFGCQLVEADLSRQTMVARFCPTDVIRFSQELVNCRAGLKVSELYELLRERSRALGTTGRCTMVVEWVIDGQLSTSLSADQSLCEVELLKDLRASLHAGHSGAWPCRIRFSDTSSVAVVSHRSLVTHEFSAVVRERFLGADRQRMASGYSGFGLPLGAGSEVPVGLDVLRRVA